ncbi:guanine nucleotide exchange protein smcr8b isoform X2 [Hippocampus zosterae]|uniref:guanine nucleotide exchange protein smcr8b isoform X2 n=1 Tax=Hippocampus zosterae TaxID=109293 RepID=UPI00223D5943|nr:guanine nucleotide exchange protein smcr8b isoform X2 [Hippocampus zosterae]
MISSPDLLPFTVQGGFGDPEDGEAEGAHRRPAGGLFPEEFSVPPPPGCEGHPWSSAAPFHKDFVLVAEFSEQVGPTPVMTIPEEAGAGGSLDLNYFSVRIMSVDYQASGPGGPSPSASGPRLNFNEDSEVVLGDSAERAFAYVRHVTLLDPAARGMVRPFCLAYVCSQQAKIMDNFGRLSAGFGRAADSLKTGNRQAFSLELHGELHRMQYERLALLRDAGMGEKRQELEALERAMAVHQELLRQVACYPNRKLKRPDFLPYEPADARTDAPAAPPPVGSERRLKPIRELCNGYFLSLMTEQLARTELRLRGDVAALRGASITRSLRRRLKLTNFLFEQPEDEEEEDDGEEEMSRESANGPSSESRAEAEEAASGEMTGSISSGDSFQVMATERSYRTLAAPAVPLASSLDAAPSDGEPLATSGVWPASRDTPPPSFHSPPVSGRANGEDGIEVLGATESIAPEDLAAISEEEPSEDDETAKSADRTPANFPSGRRSLAQSEKGAGRDEAGLLARRFSERHSFSQQVVFCLLSGRPLVLLSADEGKLRSAAEALTLFLPAPAGAVAPCLRAPPRLADLLQWRLIGFHRSRSSDPLDWLARYGRYLAVLDLDRRTLRCPPYSGSLAGLLVGSAAPAAAFLPRVRSGLTALANRVLLFTFGRRGDDDGDDDRLDAGDLAVMRFLSDLIKRRHAGRGPPALRFSYVALRLHKDTSAA